MLHAIRHMRRPDPVPILPPGWFEVPGHGPVAGASRTYETVGGLRIIHSLDVLDDDPSKRSSWPGPRPVASRISSGETRRISRVSRIVSGWFARYVSWASGINSDAHRTRKPAIRYPRHDPPHPENVETAVKPFQGRAAISAIVGTRSG